MMKYILFLFLIGCNTKKEASEFEIVSPQQQYSFYNIYKDTVYFKYVGSDSVHKVKLTFMETDQEECDGKCKCNCHAK